MKQENHETVDGRPCTFRLIDTHCHLDDPAFAPDLEQVLRRSAAVGVRSWLNVGYSPERWASTIDLGSRYPGVAVVLGVHPSEAASWSTKVEATLADLLRQSGARAVGETGIDLFRGETNLDQQRAVFEQQLAIADHLQVPAVIHMRAAEPEVLDTLRAMSILPRLLFHSFDGGPDLVSFIEDIGAYVGVGGLFTRPASRRLRDHVTRIATDRIVLETDSPYLRPATLSGSRNDPGNLPAIALALAAELDMTVEHVAAMTTANAERLFGGLAPA